jgi:hypothetical protein
MVAPDAAPSFLKIGPFDISRTDDELVLRQEKRGYLSFAGCMAFASTMLCILVLGVMSMVYTSAATRYGGTVSEPSAVFSPSRNQFGFLWLVGSILVMILLPLYVIHAYNRALVYRFRRSDNVFLKGKQKIAGLRRIEYLCIRESREPDKRYVYRLHIVYNDGQQMQMHNCYDEREILNLGNEIGRFLGCDLKWRQ